MINIKITKNKLVLTVFTYLLIIWEHKGMCNCKREENEVWFMPALKEGMTAIISTITWVHNYVLLVSR